VARLRPRDRIGLIALLTVGALLAVGPPAVGASSRTAAQAAGLARAVERAHGQAAGARAVLAVVKALGWPVATPSGKPVAHGARNLPSGLLLYNFELSAAAAGLQAHQLLSLNEFAAMLTQDSVRKGNKPVTATALRLGLARAVAGFVRRPSAAGSLAGLLVRDLGLARPGGAYDIASKSVKASAITLDPVQALIVLGDMALATSARASAATAAFGGPRFDAATVLAHQAGGPCENFDNLKTAIGSGKLGISAIGGLLSNGVKIVTVSIDGVHGMLMAEAIEAKPVGDTHPTTHYGPAGHEPNAGKTIRLTVLVNNVVDTSELAVSCGPLAGMKFPPHGPVKGVKVAWDGISDIGLYGSLELGNYGTVSYDPADATTGRNGEVSLVFTPKDEKLPGFGTIRTGMNTGASANVHIQSALGNLLGSIANYFVPLRTDFYPTVTAHVPRGFKFGPALLNFTQSTKSGSTPVDISVKGQLCGEDPYADPFDMDETLTSSFGPTEVTYQLKLPPGGSNVTTGSDLVHTWSLPPLAGPYPDNPFRLKLTITPNQASFNGSVTPSQLTVTPDVTEDTTCPLEQGWRF
jgi:hypothetical protein